MGKISRKDSVEKGIEIMVRWKSIGKKFFWEEIPKGTERKEACSGKEIYCNMCYFIVQNLITNLSCFVLIIM
jgi:hypothetical protein